MVVYGDVHLKNGTRVTDFETGLDREEFGKGMVFTWLGNDYVTNYKEEGYGGEVTEHPQSRI